MNNLLISKARTEREIFPVIELNAETGICNITGNSYMQNSSKFFKPVIDWFKEYTSKNNGDLLLIYNLHNLNTGTSRVLFEILELLKAYKTKGYQVKIKWNFIDKSEIHIDDTLDLISEFGIEVEIIKE